MLVLEVDLKDEDGEVRAYPVNDAAAGLADIAGRPYLRLADLMAAKRYLKATVMAGRAQERMTRMMCGLGCVRPAAGGGLAV
jgi:hypothetical protein